MKIAIVTGASSGMGREFVLQLTQYITPDEIWVIARRQAALETLQAQSPVPIRPVPLDLGDPDSFTAYRKLLKEENPEVRLLINAAGFGKFGSYANILPEEDCAMIDLNCKALVLMTRLTLPYMGKNSHIVQLDSLSAFQPVPYITTYGATKAFVLSYSRAMNRELKSAGIRVMAVSPAGSKRNSSTTPLAPIAPKSSILTVYTKPPTWSVPHCGTCTKPGRMFPSTVSPSGHRSGW